MEDDDKKKLENVKITLSYLNNKVKDFKLPPSLNEFRKNIKSIFQIPNKLDEIFITYIIEESNEKNKKKEKIIEIKRNEEYISLLKKINSDEIKDDIIFIETERVPDEISRETPQTFEEEIDCLIRTHLRAAGERIKKGLSAKRQLYPSSYTRNKICSKCRQPIIGKIFRGVTELEQKSYCEKYSYNLNIPMFIIH